MLLGSPWSIPSTPTIFVDDDNTPYIIYGEGDYQIARLKDSMIELDEEPRLIPLERKDVFPEMDKNSLHKHNGTYYLSCSGYYATSKNVYGPYEYRGLVGEGWQLESVYAHGDFFIFKGQWYHVWCKYRNRAVDRIRDCYIAPVHYTPEGLMYDDLEHLRLNACSAPHASA